LSAAYFLACEGHVEIFEASPHPGGMLAIWDPPYRLPNDIIDKEVEGITALGVKFITTRSWAKIFPIQKSEGKF
jgi:NADPH-dependent glutamate synthase beta subunit-like oxidoreductase